MEARLFTCARQSRAHSLVASLLAFVSLLTASSWLCRSAAAQHIPRGRFVAHSQNFIVFASSPDWAKQVSQAAEQYRRDLAMYWLGEELPTWSQRCPIHVTAGGNLGASGETRFSPTVAGVGNWMMSVNGTPQRILDSVLPHEISHTILATHFAAYAQVGKFVPRWADEGACTTVEHDSEKQKHRHFLHQFLQTGRGLAFNRMFRMKEYPSDILPLYAQGHSAVQFLIDQSSPQGFIKFLEQGMQTGAWEQALRDHYDYQTIGEFQSLWNKWLFDGSPTDIAAYAPRVASERLASLASNGETDSSTGETAEGKIRFAIGTTDPAPVKLASNQQKGSLRFASASAVGSTGERGGSLSQSNEQLAGNDSYYKRRLRQFSDSPASGQKFATGPETPSARSLPSARPGSSAVLGQIHSSQAMSRPQKPQSTQVQVLELGNSIPMSGSQYSLPRAQPQPTATLPNYQYPSSRHAIPLPAASEPVRMVPIGR